MISFTQQTTHLAQKILEHISYSPLVVPRQTSRITGLSNSPWDLLRSFSELRAGQADLTFLDLPRASSSGAVKLFCFSDEDSIIERNFKLEDTDYLTTLAANFLAIARLSKRSLSSSGVAALTTNWQHYVIARSAFDLTFGTKNCLGELVYQTREGGGSDSKYMSIDHESLLFYSVAPANVGKFQVPKTEKELNKYNKEDSEGRYTWDTFIRKQAKTYYPITCPDGSILEYDNDGNKISWLRSEKRFKSDLEKGDVKFELVDGKYKLYYKDRVKDLKILRSVTLSSTLGSEVFETLDDQTKLKELLTKHGSSELKNLKVPYLKSKRFYKLIFDAIASNARTILIPFPEYGSAGLALLESRSKADLITTVSDDFTELWKKRFSGLTKESSLTSSESITLEELLIEKPASEAAEVYTHALECRYPNLPISDSGSFHTSEFEGAFNWFGSQTHYFIVYIGPSETLESILHVFLTQEPSLAESEQISFYSSCDIPESVKALFKGHVDVYNIPESLAC